MAMSLFPALLLGVRGRKILHGTSRTFCDILTVPRAFRRGAGFAIVSASGTFGASSTFCKSDSVTSPNVLLSHNCIYVEPSGTLISTGLWRYYFSDKVACSDFQLAICTITTRVSCDDPDAGCNVGGYCSFNAQALNPLSVFLSLVLGRIRQKGLPLLLTEHHQIKNSKR
jgi:hypothetical protein